MGESGIDCDAGPLTTGNDKSTIPAMASKISAMGKSVLFTVLAPGTVAGYIPWWLRDGAHIAVRGIEAWAAAGIIAVGVAIYLHTAFWGFAGIGMGTPAPIDPPKILVVRGLHRYVRNPMYVGVALALLGQAWLFRSRDIAIYTVCVVVMFHVWVLVYEEPTLQRQFGDEYERYRGRVPRWFPKWRR